MDKILAPIKQRILKYIDIKGIEKKKFFDSISVAASNFRSKSLYSEVGGDVIAKISSKYPDINPQWLLTGKGEMLIDLEQSDFNRRAIALDAVTRHSSARALTKERIGRLEDKIKLLERENSLLREMVDFLKAQQ